MYDSIEIYTVPKDASTPVRERNSEMNKSFFISEEEIFQSSSLKEKPGLHVVYEPDNNREFKISIGDDTNSTDSARSEKSLPEVRFAQTTTSSVFSSETKRTRARTPTVFPNTPPPPMLKADTAPPQPNGTNQQETMGAGDETKDNAKPPDYNETDDTPAETSSEGLDPESLMFRDGKRLIDMVLAFEEIEPDLVTEIEAKKKEHRKNFQQNLIKEGLELELEHKSLSFDGKTWFLKIHIPSSTEKRIAEAIGLKLPIKRLISISAKARVGKQQANIEKRQAKREEHDAQREERQAMRQFKQAHRDDRQAIREGKLANVDQKQGKRDKKQMKLDKKRAKRYEKQAQRDAKQAKLDAKQADRDEKQAKREAEEAIRDDIEAKLIAEKCAEEDAQRDEKQAKLEGKRQAMRDDSSWYTKVYMNWCNRWRQLLAPELSFYAAHQDGVKRVEQFLVKERHAEYTNAQRSFMVMQILRRTSYDKNQLLYVKWASVLNLPKEQPLWLIRRYFGSKIGLYFCWLGFYTWMLVLPAIVGTLCFLYGILTMGSFYDVPSNEICNTTGPGNITLCPLCDVACRYQKLSDSCAFAKLSYLFDNPATVFFAIFMSFWATTFLELWKRRESMLRWEWDLYGIEDYEESRPEFESSVKTFITNPVTRVKEPHIPTWEKFVRYVATSSIVLFLIAIVLGAVLGIIIYRISMVLVIYRGTGEKLKRHARIITAVAAALLNLVVVLILCKVYRKIAAHLVSMENPRTQTEYNDSFAFKIFIFECVNFYSTLIYIAFFKGLFYVHPGDGEARQSELFKLKGDICDPAGCLSELCIHLAIIMVGKQFTVNFIEFMLAWCYNCCRQASYRYATRDLKKPFMTWERDYTLPSPKPMVMFNETMKLIIQYGFVTLFVAAFPLAPLFALINNIIGIRMDAFRLLTTVRRPLPERVDHMGAWYNILKGITYLAVVSNALVIGYTSDFVPCLVYKFVYSPDFTLAGYINHSLSLFNTSDYREEWGAVDEADPPICAYIGYRNPPDHPEPYGLAQPYWHVFAARLAFIVIFEHIVFGLTGLMQVIIPDVPRTLKLQIQREAMIAKEKRFDVKWSHMADEDSKVAMERTVGAMERESEKKSVPKVESYGAPVHGLNTMYN